MENKDLDEVIYDTRKIVTSIREHLNEDICQHTLKEIVKEALETE